MDTFGLIFAGIGLLLIGTGIAVGLAACAGVVLLTSLGVISSSVLVGFWKRRTLVGVQAFLVQCGILAGAPVGAAGAWIARHVWPALRGNWQVLLAGALGGAGAGLIVAWLASAAAAHIARHAWPWLSQKVTTFQRGHP